MTAPVAHPPIRMNWPRVGALSGTMALHAGLLLLLLAPPVALQVKKVMTEEKLFVDFIVPQEVKPIPPDPVPRHKETPPPPRVERHIAPPPTQTVVTTETSVMSTPAQDSGPPAPPQTAPAATPDVAPTQLDYRQLSHIPYPIEALRRHEEGTVILRVLVGADGIPQSIEIEKSSGSSRLDNAARDAVKHLSFKPGTRNGIAQTAWARVPISFNLQQL